MITTLLGMNRIGLFLLFVLLYSGCQHRKSLIITFAGDVMLDGGVAQEMAIRGDSVLTQSMHPFLLGDFNFINLESVLANIEGTRREGGRLKNDQTFAHLLKTAGVSGASVANNHSFDYNMPGFQQTVQALKNAGISVLGRDCRPVGFEQGGYEFALLAACLTSHNQHLCIQEQAALLRSSLAFTAGHPETPLMVYLHWGLEYQLSPENWQIELAHQLVDHGVDAVIGHHPHVFQGIEYYKGKPIIYSLGNFVADAYLPATTEGVIANLELVNSEFEVSFVPVDLASYFPTSMNSVDARKLMGANLKRSPNICYYLSDNQWFAKPINSVDFAENASEWIFDVDDEYGLQFRSLHGGGHVLALLDHGIPEKPMMIHGALSEIAIADITNDGNNEIVLGITKKVQFDRRLSKRINIFRITDGGVQTVWLGTRFLSDLVSFDIITNRRLNYLQTFEIDTFGHTASRRYQWDQFGFELVKQQQ